MTEAAIIEAVVGHLQELAFVRSVEQDRSRLRVDTPTGPFELLTAVHAGALGRLVAERAAQSVIERAGNEAVPLVIAARIGPDVGRVIRAAGASYVDARGNLDLALGVGYAAHIEGRSGEVSATRGRSLGLAGYRVLFTILARPAMVWPSIRALAEAAGVSRQPALDATHRLRAEGAMVRTSVGYHLIGDRYEWVLSSWLGGYQRVVRPKLELASLRRPEDDPAVLERAIAGPLDRLSPGWRFGGTAAAFQLTGHYRGPTTVVHLPDHPGGLARALGGRPDPQGNLIVMSVPGPAAFENARANLVHPLLIYTELMASADERARESGRDLPPLFLPSTAHGEGAR